MYTKATLKNNIPVLMESAGGVHSVCIGIWVKVGSRHETSARNGISHFLEHMFFKGTESRSAQDIAVEIDSLGGELNAYTSSEYTLYYVKVLNEYLDNALDLLTDILLHSNFPDDDVEKEKGIVFEEIKMVEDNPGEYVHELFARNIWGSEGLGQSVLGSVETIGAFSRDDLTSHIRDFYGSENLVVACSGNFDSAQLLEHLERTVGTIAESGQRERQASPSFTGSCNVLYKDLSEAHVCVGLQGLPYSSDSRYAMHLLNTVLGSGISSRLFQNIREKRGLVYSIYSYHVAYVDTGLWAVYAGTDRKHVSDVISMIHEEIRGLASTVTEAELSRAKAQLKGNLILALESTSNKMTNIGKQELYYGTYLPPEEIIRLVEAVALDDLRALAGDVAGDRKPALTVYGPVRDEDLKTTCML